MSISLRVTEEELSVIKSYAELHGTTVSEAVRDAILEKIENEFDLKLYEKALEEHKKNPKTYTHEEIKKRLGLE